LLRVFAIIDEAEINIRKGAGYGSSCNLSAAQGKGDALAQQGIGPGRVAHTDSSHARPFDDANAAGPGLTAFSAPDAGQWRARPGRRLR